MKQTFTAVVKQEGDSWFGWIEEVPGVNCQEATREEAWKLCALPWRKLSSSTGRRLVAPPARATRNSKLPYEAP